jgi:hypothetical protein
MQLGSGESRSLSVVAGVQPRGFNAWLRAGIGQGVRQKNPKSTFSLIGTRPQSSFDPPLFTEIIMKSRLRDLLISALFTPLSLVGSVPTEPLNGMSREASHANEFFEDKLEITICDLQFIIVAADLYGQIL